jgi:alpha-1,3-mannosyltransferase
MARYTSRLPRAVIRAVLLLTISIAVVYFVARSMFVSPSEWDRVDLPLSDRRPPSGGGALGLLDRVMPKMKPVPKKKKKAKPVAVSGRRPDNEKVNYTLISYDYDRPVHRGRSRIPLLGLLPSSSETASFEYAELPTLDEAFAHLHPMLRDVKERNQQIPREHELTSPIFPPFLTDNLKNRYAHLLEEWTPEGGYTEGGEKRWLLVTVCRQVAGGFSACILAVH